MVALSELCDPVSKFSPTPKGFLVFLRQNWTDWNAKLTAHSAHFSERRPPTPTEVLCVRSHAELSQTKQTGVNSRCWNEAHREVENNRPGVYLAVCKSRCLFQVRYGSTAFNFAIGRLFRSLSSDSSQTLNGALDETRSDSRWSRAIWVAAWHWETPARTGDSRDKSRR